MKHRAFPICWKNHLALRPRRSGLFRKTSIFKFSFAVQIAVFLAFSFIITPIGEPGAGQAPVLRLIMIYLSLFLIFLLTESFHIEN